jgi:uncharacterized membrane protein
MLKSLIVSSCAIALFSLAQPSYAKKHTVAKGAAVGALGGAVVGHPVAGAAAGAGAGALKKHHDKKLDQQQPSR